MADTKTEEKSFMEAVTTDSKMKYNWLGETGLKVSELCLGTMTFGKVESKMWLPTISTEESFVLMDKFVEYGGNFIDTANMYGNGESERVVGKWMKARNNRHNMVLATKGYGRTAPGPNNVACSRKHIIKCVDDSLERLQTDFIDLYQLHLWDPATPIREILTTLNDLVRAGKIHYIGVSNWPAWAIQEARTVAKYEHLPPFVSTQTQYNLLTRGPEYEIFPACKKNNMAYLPWSPLKGGWLSGKYTRGMKEPTEGRVAWAQKVGWTETNWATLANDNTWNVVEACAEIAKECKKTSAQVALRWLIQRPGVTSTIIGARKLHHLEDNLGAVLFELTDAQMEKLNKASYLVRPYPYNLLEAAVARDARNRY